MEQKRSVRLVLKTSDLTANSTITTGTCDQFRTSFTWSNINLRMLLGDLYYQYDYFNMCLISISSGLTQAIAAGATADDKMVSVKISGLPFVSQSYNQATGNNGALTTMGVLSIPLTAVCNTQQYNNVANVMTFTKDQDLCNLNISLFRVIDDVKPTLNAGNINPQFTFIFTIIGIDKADNEYRINHSMKIN
jgi:hypothetical protein